MDQSISKTLLGQTDPKANFDVSEICANCIYSKSAYTCIACVRELKGDHPDFSQKIAFSQDSRVDKRRVFRAFSVSLWITTLLS